LTDISIKRFRYLLKKFLRRNIYIQLAFIFIILFTIGTLGMYIFERGINKNFSNIGQSFWSSLVYLLSGFEDREPITTEGRIFSIFIFIGSICIIGSVAGNFAYIFLRRREVKMPKNVTNQIVVCNWNEGGDKIIKEIHAPVAEPETEVVVITDKEINEEELRKSKEYEKVYFIRSDPTLHDVLKASRVHLARSIIILADNETPDPDAKTAMIALAIRNISNIDDGKPHIVAEAINHRKIEHLKNAGVDEVICASDFGLGIIAQCAITGRLSKAYQQLLSYSGDTNELYIIEYNKIPKKSNGKSIFDGLSFEEASDLFIKKRDANNPVILVGVRRGNRVILNPKNNWKGPKTEKFEKFQEGDSIVVMAFEMPDLSKILK
jgi:voltage-gated potassium channel Kch